MEVAPIEHLPMTERSYEKRLAAGEVCDLRELLGASEAQRTDAGVRAADHRGEAIAAADLDRGVDRQRAHAPHARVPAERGAHLAREQIRDAAGVPVKGALHPIDDGNLRRLELDL